ncbi:SAM-dependent methyltransferase [Methylibium sp. Pch-M]|nr:SAM-dependent methyltransferase [Methylibium sp. Pch-M]
MRYPGGKGGAGVAQTIINQIPPHRVYIEPFVGGGAVFRAKAPAASSLLADRDPAVAEHWRRWSTSTIVGGGVEVLEGCALELLSSYPWCGDEFVYLDPPYHPDSRACATIYRCEMGDAGHRELLTLLERLPVRWALSGYRCALYDDAAGLHGWRRIDFNAMTRGGVRVESLWMNYPAPATLAEYTYAGSNFRERQRIGRKVERWLAKLDAMDPIERNALLSAMSDRDRDSWNADRGRAQQGNDHAHPETDRHRSPRAPG